MGNPFQYFKSGCKAKRMKNWDSGSYGLYTCKLLYFLRQVCVHLLHLSENKHGTCCLKTKKTITILTLGMCYNGPSG